MVSAITEESMVAAHPHILVVDDDAELRDLLVEYLTKQGFVVHPAADGEAMRSVVATQPVALVVLDLCLPGEDGLVLARWLRAEHQVGIIMLTAADEVIERVVGLELGADDYVAKPYDPRELRARIHSVLRRRLPPCPPPLAAPAPDSVRMGRCRLHLTTHRLYTLTGDEVPLTPMEFALLQTFAAHPHRVLGRQQLAALAHDQTWSPDDRSLDIRVARVRRKIEMDPARPQTIKTVYGMGYVFVPAPAA
jgi:two-component system phosphate regulon response regulator OmpR